MKHKKQAEEAKALYDRRWGGDLLVGTSYTSRTAKSFATYLLSNFDIVGKTALDIGCGDGTTINVLHKAGVKVSGVDITLKGIEVRNVNYYEAPVWHMTDFTDNQFDYTFSTDVLEHLPESVIADSLKEIDRVTKTLTVHQIATFSGTDHETVKQIEWWEKKFKKYIDTNKYKLLARNY